MINPCIYCGQERLRREEDKMTDKFDLFEKKLADRMEELENPVAVSIRRLDGLEVSISNINPAYSGENLNKLDGVENISPYFENHEVYRFDIPVKGNVRTVGNSNERVYAIRNGTGDTFTRFNARILGDNN